MTVPDRVKPSTADKELETVPIRPTSRSILEPLIEAWFEFAWRTYGDGRETGSTGDLLERVFQRTTRMETSKTKLAMPATTPPMSAASGDLSTCIATEVGTWNRCGFQLER